MTNLENYVGKVMKNLPNLHDMEYNVGFSMHVNTFFQKLIEKEILEKGVRIEPEEFYKGIVFLNYFSLIEETKLCDNLIEISKALRQEEKELGEDRHASYLNLKTIVIEAGLCLKEKNVDYNVIKEKIREKYEKDAVASSEKNAGLYYEAIGKMICDLMGGERRNLLENVKRKNEIEALIFSDCILSVIESPALKEKIDNKLKNKEYLEASLEAANAIKEESTKEKLSAALTELFNQNVKDNDDDN